jgi:quercetin dioxygenase-like cupin family protein
MAVPHANSGEVVDVRPLGQALAGARTTALVVGKTLEIMRLVIPKGKDIPVHRVPGEMVLQCLEGRIAIGVGDARRELKAGELLYLAGDVPHSVHGAEDASCLATILLQ